jgi:ADP-heptose:LPS heptosyltransferase
MSIADLKSVLVFRNGSIGNTLVALPALHALRLRFPGVRITVVLDSIGSELLRNSPDINEIITYDKHSDDQGIAAHLKLIRALRSARPTHAILFKRFFRNGLLSYLSGARYRIGFETNGKAPFLTHTIPYDETVHAAELDMKLLSLLNVSSSKLCYRIPLTEIDRNESAKLLGSFRDDASRFVVVHYGGQTTQPDFFPLSRLLELTIPLAGGSFSFAFIGAGDVERRSAEEACASLPCSKMLMDLPPRVMAAVIERACCFIGFNSGPAHVAAGVNTPGMVFYRPDANVYSEIRKWKPLNDRMLPLIPPSPTSEEEWRKFIVETRHYIELIAASSESSGEA